MLADEINPAPAKVQAALLAARAGGASTDQSRRDREASGGCLGDPSVLKRRLEPLCSNP